MFEGARKQIVAMLVKAAAYKRIIIQSHSRWTSITTSYQDLGDSLGVVKSHSSKHLGTRIRRDLFVFVIG